MTSDEQINLSTPQFPHVQNEDSDAYLLVWTYQEKNIFELGLF